MKIKILSLFVLLSTISLFSQEEEKIVFGVKAGANISHSSLLDNDFIFGFQVF